MIRPIYTYGEKNLTESSVDVELNDPTLPDTINDLFDTMRESPGGIGLAAPQIGINKNIFVIDVDDQDEDGLDGIFINPKILQEGGYIHQINESCLSFPGLSLCVKRPTIIEVEWYDGSHQYHKQFFIDIQARIIQHEIDHLQGKLISDIINEDDKQKHIDDFENIKHKRVKADYPLYNGN